MLLRRNSRVALGKNIMTTVEPLADTWVCFCTQENAGNCPCNIKCDKKRSANHSSTCSSARGGHRSAIVVKKSHSAVLAAWCGCGRRPPQAPWGSPMVPTMRKSPHCTAKDKANEKSL
jgi:hypothetical protein